jgi:hypothetical protein
MLNYGYLIVDFMRAGELTHPKPISPPLGKEGSLTRFILKIPLCEAERVVDPLASGMTG